MTTVSGDSRSGVCPAPSLHACNTLQHKWVLDVAVQTPAHSALGNLLSYASTVPLAPGTLVRVPLARREVLGVVWGCAQRTADDGAVELRAVAGALDALAPLDGGWRDLVAFAARYYQRSLGEVALAALPPQLRDLTSQQLARRLKRHATARAGACRAGSGRCQPGRAERGTGRRAGPLRR